MTRTDKILFAGLLMVLIGILNPNIIYFIFFLSIAIHLLLPHKYAWDKISVSLAFFSFFYTLFTILNGNNTSNFAIVSVLLASTAFYRMGYRFSYLCTTENKNHVLYISLIFAVTLVIGIQNILDMQQTGIVNTTRAIILSGEKSSLNATLYGMFISAGLGCSSVFILSLKNKYIKTAYIILFINSLFVVIHLINRTGLVITAFCIIFFALYTIKQGRKRIYIILSLILISILVQQLFINENIVEAYQARETTKEYNFYTGGGRTELWAASLTNLFLYPLGMPNDVLSRYAHNMWLDIGRIAGLFPLLPFCIASIFHLKNCITCLKKTKSSSAIMLCSINIAILLNCSSEPVIEASVPFFAFIMLLWGITAHRSKITSHVQ